MAGVGEFKGKYNSGKVTKKSVSVISGNVWKLWWEKRYKTDVLPVYKLDIMSHNI